MKTKNTLNLGKKKIWIWFFPRNFGLNTFDSSPLYDLTFFVKELVFKTKFSKFEKINI